MRICSVEGCDKPHSARGYCGGHYKRWRKGQEIESPLKEKQIYPPGATCSFEGCENPVHANWLCYTHRGQQARGVPLRPIRPVDFAVVPGVLERLGISYRQLDYWCSHNYVRGLDGRGSGIFRFQTLTPEQEERLEALAVAARLQGMRLPELADAIQDGNVKWIEGFRGG